MTGYVTGLLLAVLRPALALNGAEQVQSRLRADYVDYLTYVHARSTLGGGTLAGPDLDTIISAPFQIDAYATEYRAAHAALHGCVAALNDAWRRQSPTADGFVTRVASVTAPSDFPEPDRADGVARAFMTGLITVRPA